MVGSVVINGLMGLVYAIVLLFGLGDLHTLLASKIGFPFMQLFLNVTRSPAGASILSVIVSLIAMAANAAGTTSTSRTAWAFARDPWPTKLYILLGGQSDSEGARPNGVGCGISADAPGPNLPGQLNGLQCRAFHGYPRHVCVVFLAYPVYVHVWSTNLHLYRPWNGNWHV